MPESNTSRDMIVGFIAMIVTFGASERFQKDLEPVVGYAGSVAGSILISGVIVLVVCLLGRIEKSKTLAITTAYPPTLVTFEQVRTRSIDATGSGLLSLLLAIAGALAVGFAVLFLVKRITGVNWDPSSKSPASQTHVGKDA